LAKFAHRHLDEAYPYLILDARYERVRDSGVIAHQAVLIAIGINWEGKRQVLAVEMANRESQSSWKDFLLRLKERGLSGVEFVVSDDHAGLKKAILEVLTEAAWQRCYVHFLRNALDYLPRKADDDCLQELRWIYDRSSSCSAPSWCWPCTPASPSSNSARCARRTRSMRWSRSWSTSPCRPSPTSSSATASPTACNFFAGAETLAQKNGYDLVKFFFLLTFAAAIPAIVSGGIAERARFNPQLAATFLLVGFVYPFFEGHRLEPGNFGIQAWLKASLRRGVPRLRRLGGGACGGRLDRPGRRAPARRARGRYNKDGGISAHPPSSIPFLALGAWILTVGWFGFNVMSAQTLDKISGLVAMNSLMAMVGGTLARWSPASNDPGFVHNGPLAGLVAVCAGSDLMHPLGALVTGGVAGGLFVYMFTLTQNRWKIDDVLGVWPLHGLCGAWGGIAAGIFGSRRRWAAWAASPSCRQLASARCWASPSRGRAASCGLRPAEAPVVGLRLDAEEEFNGADLSIQIPWKAGPCLWRVSRWLL
jgi:Amt family ammonium transporter